ncbi:hypothetical protein BGZ94_009971, partial [Podila epigama]
MHKDNDIANNKVDIPIDHQWLILGPFPTGMREQDFGADPLEAFGGFRSLEYDAEAKYPSELAKSGVVSWDKAKVDNEGWVHILYPDIEWKFNQQFMGWSFNQFQAWARSSFEVPLDTRYSNRNSHSDDGLVSVVIQCENVGDFYVDNERLSGDWCGYGLTRHVLRLAPGSHHTISVRVVHEVRIFGGMVAPPPSKFRCFLEMPLGAIENTVQVVTEGYGGIVIMDIVDNTLAGEWVSIALRNVGRDVVRVTGVAVAYGADRFGAELEHTDVPLHLYSSIHRPIAIRFFQHPVPARLYAKMLAPVRVSFVFDLECVDGRRVALHTDILEIQQRKWGDVYKYTFMDFDGTVHYAAAIPPRSPRSLTASAPTLVALHGAGKDHPLDAQSNHEGYDWHGASMKNVFNALESLARQLPGVPNELRGLPGIVPDYEKLFVAATPAAGYVNIKQYVPFSNWLSNSYTDPFLRGILESAIAEYDNDVYMSNTVGVPILARVGSADDNVPPFHSRKMVRLAQETAHNRTSSRLSEVTGGGHWFTGIMQDSIMSAFLHTHLQDDIVKCGPQEEEGGDSTKRKGVEYPPFPDSFEITTLNPGSMGSKGGIQIEQLHIPFRKGTIKVQTRMVENAASREVILRTNNIRRFTCNGSPQLKHRLGRVHRIVVDGVRFDLDDEGESVDGINLNDGYFVKDGASPDHQMWRFSSSNEWTLTERHRETYGPAIQILEARLVVVLGTHFEDSLQSLLFARTAQRVAQLIAHDVYLYGRGDVEIVTDVEFKGRFGAIDDQHQRVNVVLVGDAHQNEVTALVLAQRKSEVVLDSRQGTVTIYPKGASQFPEMEAKEFKEPGTGLLMLRPLGSRHLALVIAGVDPQGMESASRLFPKRTGLLVPDWVVTGPEMAWKGAGGILAAG